MRVRQIGVSYRTLTSDFYKDKKGRTIIVPACWVGDSEKTVNDKLYKVMLDL